MTERTRKMSRVAVAIVALLPAAVPLLLAGCWPDNTLTSLTLTASDGTSLALSPSFDIYTYAYTATAYTSNVTVAAKQTGTGDLITGTGTVSLNAGSNTINVTASNYSLTSHTYTITVTRATYPIDSYLGTWKYVAGTSDTDTLTVLGDSSCTYRCSASAAEPWNGTITANSSGASMSGKSPSTYSVSGYGTGNTLTLTSTLDTEFTGALSWYSGTALSGSTWSESGTYFHFNNDGTFVANGSATDTSTSSYGSGTWTSSDISVAQSFTASLSGSTVTLTNATTSNEETFTKQ